MTVSEFQELTALKMQLFGENLFMIFDETDPDVYRYGELMHKYLKAVKPRPVSIRIV